MDEGLSVGISSHASRRHPARAAPGRLAAALLHAAARLDGRVRPSETAVHWLSLIFALLDDPGGDVGRLEPVRASAPATSARSLCALNPFLTAYGEEARMYSLMALLALLTTACFLHAFVLPPARLPARVRDLLRR